MPRSGMPAQKSTPANAPRCPTSIGAQRTQRQAHHPRLGAHTRTPTRAHQASAKDTAYRQQTLPAATKRHQRAPMPHLASGRHTRASTPPIARAPTPLAAALAARTPSGAAAHPQHSGKAARKPRPKGGASTVDQGARGAATGAGRCACARVSTKAACDHPERRRYKQKTPHKAGLDEHQACVSSSHTHCTMRVSRRGNGDWSSPSTIRRVIASASDLSQSRAPTAW